MWKFTDLIVVCNSRKGSVSYSIDNDLFLPKFQKAYGENDHILIYPSQELVENFFSTYEDMSADTLAKGVETIQKIKKEVGNIFTKK